ncbi:hypothetical protein F2Q68_00013238 [Brassica cretica]|uniref:Uncharacterized protein n=1 Tax=Brassica cretica TaxID=69181 RepID=A0A8S9HFH0_BRACR|nr:hypothetical protein F2Q68_00013238 [Brassica cretica]
MTVKLFEPKESVAAEPSRRRFVSGSGCSGGDEKSLQIKQTRDLLVHADGSVSIPVTFASPNARKRSITFSNFSFRFRQKSDSSLSLAELSKSLRELKLILYGNSEAEPVAEACAQLTLEFFKGDTSLFVASLFDPGDATRVVANLQRQQVNSRLVAADYLETNTDLMDVLVDEYVLDSQHVKKFFYYIQLPNFDIAADAPATFKELLTRHKSTVADSHKKRRMDFNSKLLESSNYITRRQAIKVELL